jgi:uncharacterized membrane protein
MQCPSCGSIVDGAFCANCGSQTGAAAASVTGQPMAAALQSNIAGLLSYLVGFISGVFFMAVEPYKSNRFVRFHALQSIFLSVIWIVAHFILGALFTILPWTLWSVVSALSSLVSVGFLVIFVLLMYKAYTNEQFKLPVIGDFAERQA